MAAMARRSLKYCSQKVRVGPKSLKFHVNWTRTISFLKTFPADVTFFLNLSFKDLIADSSNETLLFSLKLNSGEQGYLFENCEDLNLPKGNVINDVAVDPPIQKQAVTETIYSSLLTHTGSYYQKSPASIFMAPPSRWQSHVHSRLIAPQTSSDKNESTILFLPFTPSWLENRF